MKRILVTDATNCTGLRWISMLKGDLSSPEPPTVSERKGDPDVIVLMMHASALRRHIKLVTSTSPWERSRYLINHFAYTEVGH